MVTIKTLSLKHDYRRQGLLHDIEMSFLGIEVLFVRDLFDLPQKKGLETLNLLNPLVSRSLHAYFFCGIT